VIVHGESSFLASEAGSKGREGWRGKLSWEQGRGSTLFSQFYWGGSREEVGERSYDPNFLHEVGSGTLVIAAEVKRGHLPGPP